MFDNSVDGSRVWGFVMENETRPTLSEEDAKYLLRYLLKYCHESELHREAEDLVQEMLLQCVEKAPKFKGSQGFEGRTPKLTTFLVAVARKKLLDCIRRSKTQAKYIQKYAEIIMVDEMNRRLRDRRIYKSSKKPSAE